MRTYDHLDKEKMDVCRKREGGEKVELVMVKEEEVERKKLRWE